MPTRVIRDTALASPTLYRLSDRAERMFWRLMLAADSRGRFDAEPRVLKSSCFPLWPDAKMSPATVEKLYIEMEQVELVRTYVIDGHRYGYFPTWQKHQQRAVSHGAPSKYPEPTASSLDPAVAGLNGSARAAPPPDETQRPLLEVQESKRPAPPKGLEFEIPASVVKALDRAPRLGASAVIRRPRFWQAAVRAYPSVNFAGEILKAEAWLASTNRYSDLAKFLCNWFRRSAES